MYTGQEELMTPDVVIEVLKQQNIGSGVGYL